MKGHGFELEQILLKINLQTESSLETHNKLEGVRYGKCI